MTTIKLFNKVIRITSIEEEKSRLYEVQSDLVWMNKVYNTLDKLRMKIWLDTNLRTEFKSELYDLSDATAISRLVLLGMRHWFDKYDVTKMKKFSMK